MGQQRCRRDREVPASDFRPGLVDLAEGAQRRMYAEVAVLADAIEFSLTDRIDQLEVSGLAQRAGFDVLHRANTSLGNAQSLGVLDISAEGDWAGVTVVGELGKVGDDVGDNRRPGGGDTRTDGAGVVTASRLLGKWSCIRASDPCHQAFYSTSSGNAGVEPRPQRSPQGRAEGIPREHRLPKADTAVNSVEWSSVIERRKPCGTLHGKCGTCRKPTTTCSTTFYVPQWERSSP